MNNYKCFFVDLKSLDHLIFIVTLFEINISTIWFEDDVGALRELNKRSHGSLSSFSGQKGLRHLSVKYYKEKFLN